MPFLNSTRASFGVQKMFNEQSLGTELNPASSAVQLVQSGFTQDGPYWIKASESAPAQQVYCILDQSWDGGGWMILAHNDATEVIYTAAHQPRLTANPAYVGTSGANSYNFTSKWSINAQDMQISKIAWCAYGIGSISISSWSRLSNVTTINTTTAHNLIVGSPVQISGCVNPVNGVDNVSLHNVVRSVPTPTSFTVNETASDISSVTPSNLIYNLTNMLISSNVITFTVSGTHTYLVGDVVQISEVSSLYNASYTIATVTSDTFTVYTPNSDLGSTNISGSVTRSPKVTGIDLNRNIKNFSAHHYGQFNSPIYIPATTTRNWTRIYDIFAQPLPWKSINDIVVPNWTYARTDYDYFDTIYLYDGLPDTRNYTTLMSYAPATLLGFKGPNVISSITSVSNDTNSDGAHGMFGFSDSRFINDAGSLYPDGGAAASDSFHLRGFDDWQDGNSLGNGWGLATGLLKYGLGAPSFIMVK
jgi:hypothetical protein